MCHVCKTSLVLDRLAKQIKNIDDGGSVSPAAVAEIMREAHADLLRYAQATGLSAAILTGQAVVGAVSGGLPDVTKGGLH